MRRLPELSETELLLSKVTTVPAASEEVAVTSARGWITGGRVSMPVPLSVMAKSGVAASLLTMCKVVLRTPRPLGRKWTLKVVLPLVCGTVVFVPLVLTTKSPA